jgi:CheY-like chemotaxis protein
LRQAQKLDAIGQLTGGIAHDFNNLLTVITTTTEMLNDALADRPSLTAMVDMIDRAADRGARLTHRMLAFARRQPLQSYAVDLNETVSGMSMMLSRTLGEHIALSSNLAADAWRVLADPSQIEEALLNLAINARDAMPKGGQLIIETSNVHFSPEDVAQNNELSPGDYVSLIVSDTGQGMSADVAARAIEPFFTTKEVGKGSGLGLSMVYGFVKQSQGHMVIYSELDFGTSIKLFLPRAADAATARSADTAPENAQRARGETILIVEDDVDVRAVAVTLLEGLGYKVRAAQDGPSALHALAAHNDIALLFTDLMMPGGMTGVDLVHAARRDRPNLKALLTSGYPAQVIESRGAAPTGARILAKPYRKRELARAIRAAIDGEPV